MTKRMVIWLSALASVLVLGCAGAVGWYAMRPPEAPPVEPTGVTRLLTLDGSETQTRLDLPTGTKIGYAVLYADGDWAAAVKVSFDRAALPEFIAANQLPAPINGLRPVPTLTSAPPPPVPAPDPSASGAQPGASGAPPGASGAPPEAPASAEVPQPFGGVFAGDPDWHPERAKVVSGIPRNVRSTVARWIMFDLDNEQTVTAYIYATPEVPISSRTPSPSLSG